MDEIIYYKVDNDPNLIRRHGHLWEKYLKNKGWIEDTYYVGICTGDIHFYDEITEQEAMKKIEAIERN